MSRTGTRSNYFFRNGTITMATPGKKDQVVDSVSGRFVDIVEKVTRKVGGWSTHWIDIELDKDEYGPTKGIYLNAYDYASISGVVALYRLGRVLKEDDELTFHYDIHGRIRIDINRWPILTEDGDEKIFHEQKGSFVSMLNAVRGKQKDLVLWDEEETDSYIKVIKFVQEFIWVLEKEDIRSIVLSYFLPEFGLAPDCSFNEMYPLLIKKYKQE